MRHMPRHAISEEAAKFLAVDPSDRPALVVLSDEELIEIRERSGNRADASWKRALQTIRGKGDAARVGGAAAAQAVKTAGGGVLAAGAAGAAGAVGAVGAGAAVVALSPAVVGAAAAGIGVAILLDRRDSSSERGNSTRGGIQLIDEATAVGLSSNGLPLRRNLLYCVHPIRSDRYLPYGIYHRDLLAERAREAESFFLHCGASRIELTVEYGKSLDVQAGVEYKEPRFSFRGKTKAHRAERSSIGSVIEARGYRRPRRLRLRDWTWARVEPDWLDLYEKRHEYKIKSRELSTVLEEDRAISAEVAAKLPKIASVDLGGSAKTFERTKWIWHVTFPD